MKSFNTLFLAASLITGAHAALVEKAVTYQQGGTTLEGYHGITPIRHVLHNLFQPSGRGDS